MKLHVTAVVIVGALATTIALADLVPVGDPILGASWGQAFYEDVGTYDFIGVKMISAGDAFSSPTFRNFYQGQNHTTWSLLYEDNAPTPSVASAQGQPSGNPDLYFELWFNGDKSNTLTFDFVSFLGNQINNSARATWDGSKWSSIINYGTSNPQGYGRPDFVPAPGAVVLGACGLGLVGWVKRRLA